MFQLFQTLWFHLNHSAKPNSNSWTGLVNPKVPFLMNWWITERFFSPGFRCPSIWWQAALCSQRWLSQPILQWECWKLGLWAVQLSRTVSCANLSSWGTSSSSSTPQLVQQVNCHSVAAPSELLTGVEVTVSVWDLLWLAGSQCALSFWFPPGCFPSLCAAHSEGSQPKYLDFDIVRIEI